MITEKEIMDLIGGLGEWTEERLTESNGQQEKVLRVLKREGSVFLVIHEDTDPLRVEMKCDGKLGKLLREKYESVLLSKTLGGSGVEVICSGQLEKDDVLDLVRLSWNYC